MITKPIMREFMALLHKGSHWGSQAMCDVILRTASNRSKRAALFAGRLIPRPEEATPRGRPPT